MSSIAINIEYLKSWSGIFKIVQLVLGTICVGIIGNEFNTYGFLILSSSASFFLVATTAFYIGTFLLFISYLLSPSAASIIPKTIYEFLYHSLATILLLAASITMLVQIHKDTPLNIYFNYKALLAASICNLLNTILYICSSVISFSTYGDD